MVADGEGKGGRPATQTFLLRWTVRMAKDRKLFTAAQFEFSARVLNECSRMVGGWLKSRA